MITGLLFLCLGFLTAVLFIDVTFDRTAPRTGSAGDNQKPQALDAVTIYYRHITRNPYPLMVVMITAIGSTVAQVVQGGLSRWVACTSLWIICACAVVAVLKVIPAAQHLASGEGEMRGRINNARAILSHHLLLLAAVVLLVVLQFLGVSGLI